MSPGHCIKWAKLSLSPPPLRDFQSLGSPVGRADARVDGQGLRRGAVPRFPCNPWKRRVRAASYAATDPFALRRGRAGSGGRAQPQIVT
jgi:hypothetical protein